MQGLVDDPELVVQEALPHEHGEEGRHREGQHEQRALGATQHQARLVERDREEEADRELDQDGQEREGEGPDEDADERIADERVGEDRLEVLQADVRAPARLEDRAVGRLVRPFAVVRVHRPRLDVLERVVRGVVDEGRLHLVRDRQPFRRDVRVLSRRDLQGVEIGVDREQVVALDDFVALGRHDRAVLDCRRSRFERLETVARADEEIAGRVVLEEEDELAVALGRRRRVRRSVRRCDERPLLDRDDRFVLRQVVQCRPVGEGDVDVRDDWDRDERDQEDRARHEVLERHQAPIGSEVDDVDDQRRRTDDDRSDPPAVGDQDPDRPHGERVQDGQQPELDHESDRAREEADRSCEERRPRNRRVGCHGNAGHGLTRWPSDDRDAAATPPRSGICPRRRRSALADLRPWALLSRSSARCSSGRR